MDKPGRGYRPKNGGYDADEMGIGLHSRTLLVIRLPDSRALRVVSRSLFLAMVLLALPSLGSIIGAASSAAANAPPYDPELDSSDFKILPILLRDLMDEGLIKKGQKGFVLGAGISDIEEDFEFLRDSGVDLLTGANLIQKKKIFDFVFAPSFRGIHLITNGILKNGGLVISPIGIDPSNELRLLRDFKIVYLRRFENTIIAMRKALTTSPSSSSSSSSGNANSVSCGATPEKKRAALKGLEDVYLEPPRPAPLAKRSSFTSRKIKFLPDLLKDSLNEYPRRVFISDDSKALDWFYKNYPMRNQEFEVYDLDKKGISKGGGEMDFDWITEDIKPEDYVVMKAEAQVVEQMMKDKTLCLVDELFLECKNQWQDDNGEEEENGRSKRAYWQCLALYGKVRDEGIAVHQWWY